MPSSLIQEEFLLCLVLRGILLETFYTIYIRSVGNCSKPHIQDNINLFLSVLLPISSLIPVGCFVTVPTQRGLQSELETHHRILKQCIVMFLTTSVQRKYFYLSGVSRTVRYEQSNLDFLREIMSYHAENTKGEEKKRRRHSERQ